MNRYFYELGKKLGKIVVATGDTHYLEEREATNRSVLVLGSGMGRRAFSYDKKLYFNGYVYSYISKKIIFVSKGYCDINACKRNLISKTVSFIIKHDADRIK